MDMQKAYEREAERAARLILARTRTVSLAEGERITKDLIVEAMKRANDSDLAQVCAALEGEESKIAQRGHKLEAPKGDAPEAEEPEA